MKKIIMAIVVAGVLSLGSRGVAEDKSDAAAELKALVTKIQGQLRDGKKTEADLAGPLKEFDALLEKHKGEKTEDVAQIAFMKAMLYVQVFDNLDKGKELVQKIKTDFPDTEIAKKSEGIVDSLTKQQGSKAIRDQLVVGSKFPDFQEKDLNGKPLAIANYKGKAVLIDFWATWCGPCVGELPNVVKTYKKHHDQGFEIIGISLDQKEEALKDFIGKHEVTWAQYFDGKGWENKLAQKYGVNSIPATYLLDGEGKIVAKDVRGEALETEVSKLVAK